MENKRRFVILVLLLACTVCPFGALAQKIEGKITVPVPEKEDSTYIKSFRNHFTVYTFLSRKYTSIKQPGAPGVPAFRYLPNNTYSVGLGFAYRYYSLSLGIGLQSLNRDKDLRGETRLLDLQTNIYTRKWIVDLSAQFYKGYYLSNKGFVPQQENYWLAPDLRLRLLGGSAYYVLNHKNFSFRASNALNEWQQKTSGSLLLGLEAYMGIVKNEQGLVPRPLRNTYPQGAVNRVGFTQIGPGIGYSQLFVFRQHFFASLTGTLNPVFGFTQERSDLAKEKKVYLFSNYNLRATFGYFAPKWSGSLAWAHTNLFIKGSANNRPYQIQTGSIRLMIAYRFLPGNKTRQLFQLPDPYVEKVMPLQNN